MSKAYLVAFVVVAGIAVTGVDYVNQSRAAEQGIGEMSAGAYVATISDRLLSQKAAAESAAQSLMPEEADSEDTAETGEVASDPAEAADGVEEKVVAAETEAAPSVKVSRKAKSKECSKKSGIKRCVIISN